MVAAVVATGVEIPWHGGLVRTVAATPVPLVRRADHPANKPKGNQLGELARDICHRIFCSIQAASRTEQGAGFAESVIPRDVHDGTEQVAR